MEFPPVPGAHQSNVAAAPARRHPTRDRLIRPTVVGPANAATSSRPPRHLSASPGGEHRKKALHRRLPGGEPSAVSSSGHTARIRVPERVSIRSFAWPSASVPGGTSATALAVRSDRSQTTSDNYGQYKYLGGFLRVDFLPNGSSPFRHGDRWRTEHACPSQAARGRWSGSALQAERLSGLPSRACMAGCPPAPGSRHCFGSTAAGHRHAAGCKRSALKRPMRRVEQLWKTGLSDAANAREPAYPLWVQRG